MSHKKYREETNCLNCGAKVTGNFCSQCGQENLETHENFLHIAGHFIADYFHFDSKFFRSLFPLFLKPGFLTKEYWEGRRVSYIHPLRMFFFVTIIFVLSSSAFYHHFAEEIKDSIWHGDPDLSTLDSSYLSHLDPGQKIYFKNDSIAADKLKEKRNREARQLRKLRHGTDDVAKSVKYVTFFMLPIYAFVFWLLYLRRKSFYVDQLVYMMHLQTFLYALLSVMLLLPFVLPMSLAVMRSISVLIILIYIAVSLRYLYHQPWWKTILKALIATFFISFSTGVGIVLVAFLDAVFIQ